MRFHICSFFLFSAMLFDDFQGDTEAKRKRRSAESISIMDIVDYPTNGESFDNSNEYGDSATSIDDRAEILNSNLNLKDVDKMQNIKENFYRDASDSVIQVGVPREIKIDALQSTESPNVIFKENNERLKEKYEDHLLPAKRNMDRNKESSNDYNKIQEVSRRNDLSKMFTDLQRQRSEMTGNIKKQGEEMTKHFKQQGNAMTQQLRQQGQLIASNMKQQGEVMQKILESQIQQGVLMQQMLKLVTSDIKSQSQIAVSDDSHDLMLKK